ncbi:MAG TPA: SxtJ family membrane protein [Gemmatimonadaceae bacterium]|nr:SxtJ family membrane protein [Gemmatimonadaceae bacterium]
MLAHETAQSHRARKRGSARSFGLAFATVFALLALFPLLRHQQPRLWLLAPSLVLGLVALVAPRILDAPNHLWLAIGERLSRVTSTILVTVIYFVVLTPMGIFARLRGKDSLKTSFAPPNPTYWIARDRPDPTVEGLTRQF